MGIYYNQIASYPMLAAGWARVEASDGAAGADDISLYQFALRLEAELTELSQELRERTYTPRPLLRVEIAKPNGGTRVLGIPAVRDRVAQGAALAVIGPLIERELEDTSYAYRPGRSYRDALAHIERLRDEGFTWVVDADITKFFDNVEHDLLLRRLRELVPDEEALRLVGQWIATPMVSRKHGTPSEYVDRPEGLPQGAVISPALANLFLDRFDESLAAEGYRLVRYADDFVILCRNRPKAEAALRLTEALLNDLALELHPEKTRVVSFDEGFKYLGALFVRSLVLPDSEAPPDLRTVPASSQRPGVQPSAPAVRTPLSDALMQALRDEELTPESLRRKLQVEVGARGTSGKAPKARSAEAPESPGAPEEENPEAQPPVAEPTPAVVEELTPRRSGAFLRTLYILEQGTWLKREGGRFVVTRDGERILEVPTKKVEQVLVFGTCTLSAAARRFCLQEEIPVFFLSMHGNYYGQLTSDTRVHLMREALQYRRATEPGFQLDTARRIVAARLSNTRHLLQRRRGDADDGTVAKAAEEIHRLERKLPQTTTVDEVRGYEGRGAAILYGLYGRLIRVADFPFTHRNRRPPTDAINAMLSFGFTLLFQNVRAMLHLHRLNPYLGHLHSGHDYHPALASDLMEEFRTLIEGMVLEVVNRRQLRPDDFFEGVPTGGGPDPCRMRPDGMKRFIGAFEQLMHRGVTHPETGFKVTYRRCIDLQVRAYLRHLDGTEPYQPFVRR